ncbi:unnamed protein product [Triticum turgidum subsp. durum]|uniref:Uncharacterized protein n=1 Tax=Triticum turgidum subsp. durum TaxID=4567 RepID=A0A9R0YPJ4_TRITD|nr:unnamed protein product [Triticum turgidum subsp. durum]
MAQVWAVFLAVGSLAIGMLGVLGVWLCYLFQAVALGPPPAPPPETPETVDDDNDDKNGLSEAELRQLGGVVQPEPADGEEEEEAHIDPINPTFSNSDFVNFDSSFELSVENILQTSNAP